MSAPDYLAPALHAEYDRLTDMLTAPARVRDASVIAKALHEGYRRGRMDAIGELRTSADVMAELGIATNAGLWKAARKLGVGWYTGRDWLFTPQDVEVLRNRPGTGRPRKAAPAE